MKKVILLITVVSLVSCSKQKCWQCHTSYQNTDATAHNAYSSTDTIICDKTRKEIVNYENENTYQIGTATLNTACIVH